MLSSRHCTLFGSGATARAREGFVALRAECECAMATRSTDPVPCTLLILGVVGTAGARRSRSIPFPLSTRVDVACRLCTLRLQVMGARRPLTAVGARSYCRSRVLIPSPRSGVPRAQTQSPPRARCTDIDTLREHWPISPPRAVPRVCTQTHGGRPDVGTRPSARAAGSAGTGSLTPL